MKKLIFLGMAIMFLNTCENKENQYSYESPEINTYKKVIEAYEKRDWKNMASHYSDTAIIQNNFTLKDGQSIDELVEMNKGDARLFSFWKYDTNSVKYEMVVKKNGETWVNFWGIWEAGMAENNQIYKSNAHISAQFVNGKIVRENGYWDLTDLMKEPKKAEKVVITGNPKSFMKEEYSSEK